jgi:hypothetical protein
MGARNSAATLVKNNLFIISIDRDQAYRNISSVELLYGSIPYSSRPDNAAQSLEKVGVLVRSCLKLVLALSLLPGTAQRHRLGAALSPNTSLYGLVRLH